MADRDGRVIRIADVQIRRLERRLTGVEEAQRTTNAKLDEAVDVLTRLVRVVAAQNERTSRHFAQLRDRLDRLTRALSPRALRALATASSRTCGA